jgi:hypothetical protein
MLSQRAFFECGGRKTDDTLLISRPQSNFASSGSFWLSIKTLNKSFKFDLVFCHSIFDNQVLLKG